MAAPEVKPLSGRTEFGRRALSAVILAPIVVSLSWFSASGFIALLAIAVVVMAKEWISIADLASKPARIWVTLIPISALGIAFGGFYDMAMAALLAGAAGGFLFSRHGIGHRLSIVGAILYIGGPVVALAWLRTEPVDGRNYIVWLLVIVWSTDIMAYLVGRWLRGPKLFPKLSPGKTWSGAVGGVLGALAVGVTTAAILISPFDLLEAFGVILIISVVSQCGDLLESGLKRFYRVKDSGNLIPGHGGLMDRVDGLIAAAPAMVAVVAITADKA